MVQYEPLVIMIYKYIENVKTRWNNTLCFIIVIVIVIVFFRNKIPTEQTSKPPGTENRSKKHSGFSQEITKLLR